VAQISEDFTRRGLLAGIAGGTMAWLARPVLAATKGRARIVRIESDRLWSSDSRDPRVLMEMLNRGLIAFTGEKNPADAWRHFWQTGQRIGLKINLLGRPYLYTSRELTEAVAASVIAAGARPTDVIVWDRFRDHFLATEYKLGKGPNGESVEAGGDYDEGRGAHTAGGLCAIDRMAVERTDVTINLPLLKDHNAAGVTLALKNIAFGAFKHHNDAHSNNCDPYVPEAYAHFVTQTRLPLHILDATRACYEGGPRPGDRNRIWRENALYFASDPVALDVVGRQVIQAKRVASGLRDRTRDCRHIETAASKGLGVLDLARIEVVTIKV
jgi:Domain of unknown function (DUF362)